jgi:hypothetical protein
MVTEIWVRAADGSAWYFNERRVTKFEDSIGIGQQEKMGNWITLQ